MIRFFLDNLKGNIDIGEIDEKLILQETIKISSALMQTENEGNIIVEYSVQLYDQLGAIESYVKKIIDNTGHYPNLVVHL
jgi:hypothetical protein